jgi:hypothetical protein
MVSWFVSSHEETQLNDDSDLEIVDAVAQIQGVYAAARDNIGSSRQKVHSRSDLHNPRVHLFARIVAQ